MKKKGTIGTFVFIVYLIIVFCFFFSYDKKLLAVFSAIGSALYVIFIRKYINDKKTK